MKIHNYSAGPCILPQEVFEKAAQSILDFDKIGLSILEISHRSKEFVAVMDKARALVLELMDLSSEEYDVLFLQGGASLQFLMAPYNLLSPNGKASYLDTGTWSSKAIKEAKFLGNVDVVATGKDHGYTSIPKNYNVDPKSDYFHCTSNNTIYGTQMKSFPETGTKMVCDMSSDIFSRQLDFSKFDLIYAGAQKNMGPAGTTLVVVRKSVLGKTDRPIPTMLNYQTHIDKESMFNTPPVFAVYVSMLTLEWLKNMGGIGAIEKVNNEKADMFYSEVDRNPLFKTTVAKEDRSAMNACFHLSDLGLEDEWNKMWQGAGFNGLKGHRSVGGYRASMYNALSLDSVKALVDIMREFEQKKG